jgi:hypothetical protein
MKLLNVLIMIAAAIFFTGCHGSHHKDALQAGIDVQVDSLPGSCPYLTKDDDGNILLSWVRNGDSITPAFCYAVSTDDGKTFGKPIVIPASETIHPHSENLPKIITKPSGEMMALWGAANPNPCNKYAGAVFYSQSFDKGSTWSAPLPLVTDTASYDQRYYDVALLPGKEIAITWLDNRKTTTKEGSGLYFAVTNGRNGFQNERMISQLCCQCCRTDMFVDSKGSIHVLYRGIISDSIRDMMHIRSDNAGQSFSSPQRISEDNWVINGCPHTGPSMTENKEGLHFAWFTGGANKGCHYAQESCGSKRIGGYDIINASGSHPQIASCADGELLVAWDESVQGQDKACKRICLQKRTAAGVNYDQTYITPANGMATYPVVISVNKKSSLVAYTEKKGEENYIMIQGVRLK